MDANARLITIPAPKKQQSRKKGRRDKPFRELRMDFITEEIRKNKPKVERAPPKPYVPHIITDFTPPPGMTPRMAKKIRRKHRRKDKKELAKQEAELGKVQLTAQQKAEEQERLTKKRKADVEMYRDFTKRMRTEDLESQVTARQKLEPKSQKRKSLPKRKVQMPPNHRPEPDLGQLPNEILQKIFGYSDIIDRTSIALTCVTFGYVVMKDLDDLRASEANEKGAHQCEQEETGSVGKKKLSKKDTTKKDSKGPEMRAGYPDIRKRYNWDGERHAVMEQLRTSIATDQLYCHVCRKFEPKKGGSVISYKNCPKKTLMANNPRQNQETAVQLQASVVARSKIEKEKPLPDEIIWTENDWSVFKLGVIRSRMGLTQTCYMCPSCTDSRNNLLFPPPPEMPLERLSELGNPIGGDIKNGRVPYGQQGPNIRDPRRTYPADEKITTVEESARMGGGDIEISETNNG